MNVRQILAELREAPGRIAAATSGLSPARLAEATDSGGWTANDVLAHLRAAGDTWGEAMRRLVEEERPAFRSVNPRGWIRKTNYRELEFAPSFRAYKAQREGLLALLEALPAEGWFRSGLVTAGGGTYERTVLYYAERMAGHERSHLRQIEAIAAALCG
jgi:hypothetical protein